ncbi:hypothetical protein EDB83DRAFT_2580485 [Lactarius deliciosus]|nr:hypothetical protein EDB83DRAFT_2580485 [Lactarius deliciosus]
MDEWWGWGGDMGDESDGSDKWARVGIGGGRSGRKRAGRGVDGEGAGNKLGSEGERMDGGTRGEGKVLCDENTWGELDDAMIGQCMCYPEMTVPGQTSFFWLLAVWQRLCEVGRANEVLVVRGSIEIDGRPWYGLRWGGGDKTVWTSDECEGGDTGMGGGGNGLGITLGSSRKRAGRGVGGEDMDGAGAGNELGSRGGVRGVGDKDAGNKSGGNVPVVRAGSGNDGEGVGESGSIPTRTSINVNSNRWDRGEVARQQSAGGHLQQVQEMTGWLGMGTVGGSIVLVDRQTGGTCEDYACHLEDDRKVKWLFHWLKRAFDLEGEKTNTGRWGRIRSKIWHRSRISVSVSRALRKGVNYSRMIHLGEAVHWAHCYRVGRTETTLRRLSHVCCLGGFFQMLSLQPFCTAGCMFYWRLIVMGN